MLSVIKAAVVRQGEGESNASGMSWHSVGEGSQVFVTAHAEGDGTLVRVTVDRSGALVIAGVGSLIGSLAVVVLGLILGETILPLSAAAGLSLTAAGVAGVLALTRALWTSTSRGIQERVAALMDTVSGSLAESGGESDSSTMSGESS